jgi:hypothetical protein
VVTVSGPVAGGHAWLWTMDQQTYAHNGGVNSWNGWGMNGRFYISDPDLYRLHNEGGEACMAVKFVKPIKPNHGRPGNRGCGGKRIVQAIRRAI